MDVLRAQKISESPVMGNITYDGTPVYIQHVDVQNETARIYALENPDNELTVSLNQLEER
ncbi:H-type small acid-soluble spore protein [Salibacterium salarium]|uniref:Small, acid-soluble spore protein H n=1 Tax=Salibacterium salarium TaxID=284579 RepID=A0A428MWS5_9BACI|nr:H-type small acid-soluble spore protein [Salibacterium salarium]RSL30581.1 H-type small acid-soluble spore protein [Salibacterium salarium]